MEAQFRNVPDGLWEQIAPLVPARRKNTLRGVTEAELSVLVARYLAEDEKLARLPRFLRATLVALAFRGSVLGGGLRRARGTFLGAIETYLLRLRPEHLGPWAKAIDRRIAAALPSVALRLRLQDMARLMSDSLVPALRASADRPLRFLNLAGDTAIDTLNALLILRSEAPDLLARPIQIELLDRERAGPAFGERVLRTDGEIVDALTRLRDGPVVAVVGSVTRADEPVRRLHRYTSRTIRMRGLEAFRRLVGPTGWAVARVIEGPFSDHVVLAPMSAAR